MASFEFIFQGITARTHADAIRELFAVKSVEKTILSVAFITEDGVSEIEKALTPHASSLTVYAGIRNAITSHQGLARILGIGAELFIVDTGSQAILFHPKLYLVVGTSSARAVVGSANLTLGGLNNNIEAGLLLEFNRADASDEKLLQAIVSTLDGLVTEYPSNIEHVTTRSQLDDLLKDGRLVDEAAVAPPRLTTSPGPSVSTDPTPVIKLKVKRIYGARRRKTSAPKVPPKKIATPLLSPAPLPSGVAFALVWQSKPLTRRDLTIPKARGTNQTGSINLDKGLLEESIDHRHYFRDTVFASLTWMAASKTVEFADANFLVVLKGIGYGELALRVRHTTSTTTRTYTQNNAMTRLSWGLLRVAIARPDFIGRTMSLYQDKADPSAFLIEID